MTFVKKKEHPKQNCFDCDILICENCEPSHARFNPFHTLGDLLGSGASKYLASRGNCKLHPEQQLVIFCVMCQSVLCWSCEHATCREVFRDEVVYQRYNTGFLRDFAKSSEERKRLFERGKLSRTIQIKDIASEFRKWLGRVKPELKQCIDFLEQYRKELTQLTDTTNECKVIARLQTVICTIDVIIGTSKDTLRSVLNLIDNSADVVVAQSAFRVEKDCFRVFRHRKRYSFETRPTETVTESTGLTKQVSKSAIQPTNSCFAGMLNLQKISDDEEDSLQR